MNSKLLVLPVTLVALLITNAKTHAVNIMNQNNTKAVGHVKWHLQSSVSPEALIAKPIPENDISLFFIRPADDDSEQTSANIAINDRYQVSLQPGSYTQVYSCSGINRLSAEVTGIKTNDLLLNASEYTLAPNQNYFFYVDVDKEGNSTIQEIESTSAFDYLQDKKYQAHQITRVVPNCPAPPPPAPVQPEPKPVPILEKEVSIELEVLFQIDKAIIRSQYMHEVEKLADFLKLYANTTAVIEGHTDSTASIPYNQRLSERRANAVKSLLVTQYGVAPDRLTAIGYGELRPRATNATAEGRRLNRRTIAVVKERVRVDQDGNQIID